MHIVHAVADNEYPDGHFVHVVRLLHNTQSAINEEHVWHEPSAAIAYPGSHLVHWDILLQVIQLGRVAVHNWHVVEAHVYFD